MVRQFLTRIAIIFAESASNPSCQAMAGLALLLGRARFIYLLIALADTMQ
jgi:hypothetical protein